MGILRRHAAYVVAAARSKALAGGTQAQEFVRIFKAEPATVQTMLETQVNAPLVMVGLKPP